MKEVTKNTKNAKNNKPVSHNRYKLEVEIYQFNSATQSDVTKQLVLLLIIKISQTLIN